MPWQARGAHAPLLALALAWSLTARAQDLPTNAPIDTELQPPTATTHDEPADAGSQPATDMLSPSELEALGLDVGGGAVDTAFHLSGFADFTAFFPVNRTSGVASADVPLYQSFYVGNVNLYLSKNLSDSFRALTEVRRAQETMPAIAPPLPPE